MNRIYQSILSLALVLGLIALYIPVASSVVQNLTVVNAQGEPVHSQTVTIVFPAGVTDAAGNTSSEEKTDEKGGLYFDFPDDGEYVINYKGGSMTYVVEGGIPMYVKVGGALLAVGGIYLIADDDDDDNDSSSSSSGNTSSTSSSGTTSSTSSSGTTSSTSSSGTTSSTSSSGTTSSTSSSGTTSSTSSSGSSTSSSSSGGEDPNFDGVFQMDNFSIVICPHPSDAFRMASYHFKNNCSSVTIDHPASSTSATLTGSCNEGEFNLSGTGTWNGIGTDLWMVGQIFPIGGTFQGTATAGNDGNLPGGERCEGSFTGFRPMP